jgi:hypothetical protein
VPAREKLVRVLRDSPDWDRPAMEAPGRQAQAPLIVARAKAAEALLSSSPLSPDSSAALAERVRHRSLHPDWMYHGLDGAMALRTLILSHDPHAIELARWAIWLDDPACEPLRFPGSKEPRAWVDWRMKMTAWEALERLPGAETERLCRDYLGLDYDEAKQIGPRLFEEAARTLMAVSPKTETAVELMRHRLNVVRGRAILECLKHINEPWARAALQQAAPFALDYAPWRKR